MHACLAHACLASRDDLTMALGGDLKLTTFGLVRPQRRDGAWPFLGCDCGCEHKVSTSLSASLSAGTGSVVCIGHRQLDGRQEHTASKVFAEWSKPVDGRRLWVRGSRLYSDVMYTVARAQGGEGPTWGYT